MECINEKRENCNFKVSKYAACSRRGKYSQVDLRRFAADVKTPSQDVEKARKEYDDHGKTDVYSKLKTCKIEAYNLQTGCVTYTKIGQLKEHPQAVNPIITLDFDAHPGEDFDVEGVKAKLASKPSCIIAAQSLSGKGVFAVFRLEDTFWPSVLKLEDDQRLAVTKALLAELASGTGAKPDELPDPTRLRVRSYDDNVFENFDAEPFKFDVEKHTCAVGAFAALEVGKKKAEALTRISYSTPEHDFALFSTHRHGDGAGIGGANGHTQPFNIAKFHALKAIADGEQPEAVKTRLLQLAEQNTPEGYSRAEVLKTVNDGITAALQSVKDRQDALAAQIGFAAYIPEIMRYWDEKKRHITPNEASLRLVLASPVCPLEFAFFVDRRCYGFREKGQKDWKLCGGEKGETGTPELRSMLIDFGFAAGTGKLRQDDLENALALCTKGRRTTALKEYVEANTPDWDGIRRVDAFLSRIADVNDVQTADYLRGVSRYIWTGLYMRSQAVDTPIKAKASIMLTGKQNFGKSALVKVLPLHPAFFGNGVSLNGLENDDRQKNAEIKTEGKSVIELGETAGMTKADRNALKFWLGEDSLDFRGLFEKGAHTHIRTNLFFMTTNDDAILNDPTGNTRWLPVTVKDIPNAASMQIIAEIAKDIPQYWAEARQIAREVGGIDWQLANEHAGAARESAEVDDTVEAENIQRYLEAHPQFAANGKTFKLSELIQIIFPDVKVNGVLRRADQAAITAALKVNGFERTRDARGGKAWRIPPETV